MSRGYRLLVVAALGWLSLAAGNPPKHQAEGSDTANKSSPPPAPEARWRPYPDPYSEACYKAETHDAAELCSEWRSALSSEKAAHEARRATNWAIVATLLSVVTVIGLIITIWQTSGALREARRGNRLNLLFERRSRRESRSQAADQERALEIAERNANAAAAQAEVAHKIGTAQTRPYLIIDRPKIEICLVQYGMTNVFIRVPMKNFGNTPAIDPNIACNGRCAFQGPGRPGGGKSYSWASPLVRTDDSGITIGPGAEHIGTWQHTLIDFSLEEPIWRHERPWFSLTEKFADPTVYPIAVSLDIFFTYLDMEGILLGNEYYRLDCLVEKFGEPSKASSLRVPHDPQGAADIYPLG